MEVVWIEFFCSIRTCPNDIKTNLFPKVGYCSSTTVFKTRAEAYLFFLFGEVLIITSASTKARLVTSSPTINYEIETVLAVFKIKRLEKKLFIFMQRLWTETHNKTFFRGFGRTLAKKIEELKKKLLSQKINFT